MATLLLGAVAVGSVARSSGLFQVFRRSPLRKLEQHLWCYLALLSIVTVLTQEVTRASALGPVSATSTEFDGFGDELDDGEFEVDAPVEVPPHVVRRPGFETDHGPPLAEEKHEEAAEDEAEQVDEVHANVENAKRKQDIWDEDEFEGVTEEEAVTEPQVTPTKPANAPVRRPTGPQNYYMEAFSIVFLVAYAVNYFLGRKENERIALRWASEFASKDSIFDKNFSLLGIGEGDDAALLMKEGQNVFKFYASGRRFCQGLLATLDLKSRHDLLSCLWYSIFPKRDELTIDVYMNEESMDAVIMAVARRKVAKVMSKDWKDLQQFTTSITPPSQRKWVSEELSVVSEFREVATDLLSDAVLDLVLGEKAFREHGSNFVSLHFSDASPLGSHKNLLQFRFYLPPAERMSEITRLIQMVPYFIDALGRYKLSSHTRPKADVVRQKLQQEAFKQAQSARQEALARRREEKREELDSRLTPEALRKKEEKERAKQMKKSMPRMKVSRAH